MAGYSRSGSIRLRTLSCALALTLVLAVMPVMPAVGAPADWWVSPTGNDLTGTGARTAPYRTITEALMHAVDGDAVKVLPGVYNVAAGEAFPLVLPTGVDLVGIGPGKPKIYGDTLDSVIALTSPKLTEISGLEIAYGGSAGGAVQGGGIAVLSNTAADSLLIKDCWVHDCETGTNASGGGIFVSGPAGGGPQVMVIDCRVEDNTAHNAGGGIRIDNCDTVTIDGCVINGNTAVHDSATGGGVSVSRADILYFNDCEITRNHAGNTVGGYAGGFFLLECSGQFMNNLVALNSSKDTGCSGTMDGTGSITMRNCTIADNFLVPANPSAVTGLIRTSSGTCSLIDTIVWGNTPPGITSVTNFYNNVISDDPIIAAPEVTNVDPQFALGGTDENPDYRLERGSPAVDAGLSSAGYLDHDLDFRARPVDGDGVVGAVPDIGCYELTDGVTRRLFGDDRYKTACDIWEKTLPESSASSAVLATGQNFPDALSASALAGAVDGPLLLVKPDSVPSDVLDTLHHLGVNGVYIVGGSSVVSNGVKTALEADGFNVIRIAGDDRFKTAAAVAAEVKYLMGPRYSNRVFVATGLNFPDALAASPWAYASAIPVLLTKTDSLPAATADAIAAGGTSGVWIVGGPPVVSPAVATAIDAIPGITTPRRLAGTTRYETAVAVANEGTGADIVPELHWHEPGLATGLNFPDALAGGAASGAWGSPLLLTTTTSLPSATSAVLAANKTNVYRISVMGSTSVITDAVKTAAGNAIE